MAYFPTPSFGQVTMVPVQRMVQRSTVIVYFGDDSEQRWRSSIPVARFTLKFTNIAGYDVEVLRQFFQAGKGMYDVTWSLVFDGSTYDNCGFDQDDFPVHEPSDYATQYSFDLKVRQNLPG
jgi:hypothetical protein